MRVAIAALGYPPSSTDGIARQRQALAEGLVALGHEVDVVALAPSTSDTVERGVRVHRQARVATALPFLQDLPVLDGPLTDAQLLCERLLALVDQHPVDIVDVPLWLAAPISLVRQAPCPVVVWLQTTLLHLVTMQGRGPRAHEQVLIDIDREVMSGAAGCIADSQVIVDDVARLYGLPDLPARTPVVHPGLPDVPVPAIPRSPGLQILVVGRLEQRKGTRLLLEVLPALLRRHHDLRVRFVGRDNSGADGFLRDEGTTYVEAFTGRWPDLAARVTFSGHVDDASLADAYASADVLLHPAHFESFGLVYLEAMRAGLPVVTFAAGGSLEVFADGEGDGALLVPPGDADALVEAVSELLQDPARRQRLGDAGRRAFTRRFSSDAMARRTIAAYQEAIRTTAPPRPAGRLFQVMEALQDRDAVSRIARANAPVLADLGGARPIMALFAEATVRQETGRLRGLRPRADDAMIFHYWGFSRLEAFVRSFPGRKAVHYHNITPPRFFPARTEHYEMTRRGYAQLARIADLFDLVLGDSEYNLERFAEHLSSPRPTLCVYPAIDRDALWSAPSDDGLTTRLRAESDGALWLFVGRFAPNKRQDRVMEAFDAHARGGGAGRLALVGNMTSAPWYVRQLQELRTRLPHGARIDFIPSVTDEQLRSYYRAAGVFVCASEHEGFCVPLAEAMAFDVPVIALDRAAVGETLGPAGRLMAEWDAEAVGAMAADLLGNTEGRALVLAQQRARLAAFAPAAVRARLHDAVQYLREGIAGPGFLERGPRLLTEGDKA